MLIFYRCVFKTVFNLLHVIDCSVSTAELQWNANGIEMLSAMVGAVEAVSLNLMEFLLEYWLALLLESQIGILYLSFLIFFHFSYILIKSI